MTFGSNYFNYKGFHFSVKLALVKGTTYLRGWTLAPMNFILFIYLFGVLRHFQHCIGHITMGRWKGRGNQYIEFVRDVYCKLLTNGKQLPAFPLEAVPGTEPRPQRWEARVLPLCLRGPLGTNGANSDVAIFNQCNLHGYIVINKLGIPKQEPILPGERQMPYFLLDDIAFTLNL